MRQLWADSPAAGFAPGGPGGGREPGVPCHRVLRADGSASCAFGPGVQRSLLEAEGVAFTAEGRVDWTRSMWDGQAEARDAAHGGGLPPLAYIKGRRR